MFFLVILTPLGSPVDPDVQIETATLLFKLLLFILKFSVFKFCPK